MFRRSEARLVKISEQLESAESQVDRIPRDGSKTLELSTPLPTFGTLTIELWTQLARTAFSPHPQL